jgi:hypothetical protein
MMISGSIYGNYFFKPAFTELADFKRLFQAIIMPNSDGWSFNAYQDVEQFQVKDAVYYLTQTAIATTSHDNATLALKALKMGITASTGAIVNTSAGIYQPAVKTLIADPRGYIANHIPQTFGRYPHQADEDRILTGVYGHYDFVTGLFHGQCDFKNLGELWND